MTVLGKILVFVNLVFSLLTAGLIVMVYTTRINWHKAYTDQKAAVGVVQRDLQTAEAAQAEELKRRDADFQKLLADKNKLEGDSKGLADQLAKAKADYSELSKVAGGTNQNIKDLTDELARRKTEVDTLKKQINDQDKRIADMDRQMARLRDESVQYRIQWEQARERNQILQTQIQSQAAEIARLQGQVGGTAAPGIAPTPAGPTTRIEDLRGTVQKVEGDLATITPGSDAGVVVGGKLQVFRLQPRPEYLGELTILAVEPTQAVGRLSGSKRTQVKKGDEVAVNVIGR